MSEVFSAATGRWRSESECRGAVEHEPAIAQGVTPGDGSCLKAALKPSCWVGGGVGRRSGWRLLASALRHDRAMLLHGTAVRASGFTFPYIPRLTIAYHSPKPCWNSQSPSLNLERQAKLARFSQMLALEGHEADEELDDVVRAEELGSLGASAGLQFGNLN